MAHLFFVFDVTFLLIDRCADTIKSVNLKCIFSAVTTKRAQGKRGRIISEYKSKTTNTNHPPPLLNAAGSVQQFREYRSLECSPATPLDAEHEHNAGGLLTFNSDNRTVNVI